MINESSNVNMIGQLLGGRYQIIQGLGGGGFARTYLAEDTNLPNRRKCVVKQLCPPSKDPRTIQVARHLFANEAATLERLGHHEQIPQIFDYFEDKDKQEFYIVEEFIPGHTLAQELLPGQPLIEIRVVNLLIKVLEILVFVHEQGVIHRDIKPANLMRRQTDGKIFLIDFGAVKQVATQVVNTHGQVTSTVAIGTPSYMPLEQIHGNPQFNSDIYALGVVGIQALTGLLADDISRLRNPNNPSTGEILWRHRAQVSPRLANIIDRMVSIDCRQRYQSATQVLTELKQLVPSQIQTSHEPIPPRHLKSRRWLWLTLTGATALSVVGGLILWMFLPKSPQKCQVYSQGLEATKNQDYQKAIYDFDQCIQGNPNDGSSYFKRGYAYYQQKDYKKAVDDYSQAIRIFEQQPSIVGVGIRINKQDDRLIVDRVYPESPAEIVGMRVNDQIQEIDGKNVTSMSQQEASNLLNQGQVNSQVTLKIYRDGSTQSMTMTRMLVTDNIRAAIYIARGLALSDKGNKKAAIDDYNQALNLKPNNADAYSDRAHAYAALGDKQGAIKGYTQAIQLDPTHLEAYIGRGDLRSDSGDKSGAIDDYTQVIQTTADAAKRYGPGYLNNLHAEAYNRRGYVKYQLGETQGAISNYTQAIQLIQDDDSAYYNRGNARLKLGDKQGAIDDFHMAANFYLKHGDTKRYSDIISLVSKLQQPSPVPTAKTP